MQVGDFYAIDLLERTGRLSYRDLKRAARNIDRDDFLRQFNHPLLVGSTLYTGDFLGSGGMNATMEFVFTQADIDEEASGKTTPDPSHLRQSIYPLLKQQYSNSERNVFTVGRTANNDMVMADYSISRNHAQIKIADHTYLLQDLNATNGTFHNGNRIETTAELEIKPGDQISFGRFAFYFTPIEQVYEQLKDA